MRRAWSLLILCSMAASAQTPPSGGSACAAWQGTYIATLAKEDTILGWPSELQLHFRGDALGWGIKGEGVPMIALAAEQYRCTETQVEGAFSGAHMTGEFTLQKRGDVLLFDASDVGNVPGELNWLGYVPNRAIRLHKSD